MQEHLPNARNLDRHGLPGIPPRAWSETTTIKEVELNYRITNDPSESTALMTETKSNRCETIPFLFEAEFNEKYKRE